MRKRMNLFQAILDAEKERALEKRKRLRLRLTPRIRNAALVGLSLGLILLTLQWTGARRVKETESRLFAAERELAEILANRKARELADTAKSTERKPASMEIGSEKTDDGANFFGLGLDGSWTSVLWKLSALSGETVALQKLQLHQAGPSARQIVMEGQADSLYTVKTWLERLHRHIPGYDFMLNSQTRSADVAFPIQFKVTARIP